MTGGKRMPSSHSLFCLRTHDLVSAASLSSFFAKFFDKRLATNACPF